MTPLPKAFVLLSLITLSLSVAAEPGRGGRPPAPPAEALAACSTAEENDTCSFVHDEQTLSGVCMAGPRADLPLACRPDRTSSSSSKPKGPPPEALEACEDLDVDDTCSFDHRDRTVTGSCQPGPDDELSLACRPDKASRR